MRVSGIYKITSEIDEKVYIGQSVNIKSRLNAHKRKLKKSEHENEYLQRAYLKYGEDNFTFELIEACNIEELDNRECYWIEFYDSMDRSKGYNLESGGNKNKTFCKERIESITGEGNPMYGRKQSQEFIEFMRVTNRGSSDKLTEEDVRQIKNDLHAGETQSELANSYKVTLSTINKIAKCKNWDWVLPELNESLIRKSDLEKEERNERIIKLNKEGYTNTKIAEILNTDKSTVSRVLKKFGLQSPAPDKLDSNTISKIIEMNKQGISNDEISKLLTIGKKSVIKYLKIHNLKGNRSSKKLTKEQVIEIKHRLLNGESPKEICKDYNTARTTISDIKFGRIWSHIII
jgi:group I intron endonuclease